MNVPEGTVLPHDERCMPLAKTSTQATYGMFTSTAITNKPDVFSKVVNSRATSGQIPTNFLMYEQSLQKDARDTHM